jgi:hypothetical protein
LLRQPACKEDEQTSAGNPQRGFDAYLIRAGQVTGNAGRHYQQTQKLQKAAKLVAHQSFSRNSPITALAFYHPVETLLDILLTATKKIDDPSGLFVNVLGTRLDLTPRRYCE